jgi:hypothetical protein
MSQIPHMYHMLQGPVIMLIVGQHIYNYRSTVNHHHNGEQVEPIGSLLTTFFFIFISILVLCWGCIVTFTKVLTIYLS